MYLRHSPFRRSTQSASALTVEWGRRQTGQGAPNRPGRSSRSVPTVTGSTGPDLLPTDRPVRRRPAPS